LRNWCNRWRSFANFLPNFWKKSRPHGSTDEQTSIWTASLFFTWGLVELVRYPFYIAQVWKTEIRWLTVLRYNLWIPTYPLGILNEVIIYVSSLPIIFRSNLHSFSNLSLMASTHLNNLASTSSPAFSRYISEFSKYIVFFFELLANILGKYISQHWFYYFVIGWIVSLAIGSPFQFSYLWRQRTKVLFPGASDKKKQTKKEKHN